MMDSESDKMKILVATDCHLGYKERDPVRCKDATETFDEILQIGKENGVDFILLAGDLFDKNKPSKEILHECMKILRNHCVGDGDTGIKIVSDQSLNFKYCAFQTANCDDPGLKIKLPVFTIHGNHDDPTGKENIAAVDLLGVSGLVNYFGKYEFDEKLDVEPLVIIKGSIKVALYGVGFLRYDRMDKLFSKNNINFLGTDEDKDKNFNIFVLHQDRSNYGNKTGNFVDEKMLPGFLDLVIWGHEHECKIVPPKDGALVPISQPGSLVVTDLSKSEEGAKYVGLLTVRGNKSYDMKKIKLKTARPLYVKDVHLEVIKDKEDQNLIMEICTKEVENLINKSNSEAEIGKSPPLIRIRLHLSPATDTFSNHKFGLQFKDKVANPDNIVRFIKEKGQNSTIESLTDTACLSPSEYVSIETLVHEYFAKTAGNENSQLSTLCDKKMTEAVENYVHKDDKKAIENYLKLALDLLKNDSSTANTLQDMEKNQEMPVRKSNLTSSISVPVEKVQKPVNFHKYHSIGGQSSPNRYLAVQTYATSNQEKVDFKRGMKIVEALKPENPRKKPLANSENDDVVDLTGEDDMEDGNVTWSEQIPKEQKITSKPNKARIGSSQVQVRAQLSSKVFPVSISSNNPNVSQSPSDLIRLSGSLQSSSPQDTTKRSAPLLPKAVRVKTYNTGRSLSKDAAAGGLSASFLSQPNIQPPNMSPLQSQPCTRSAFSVSTSSFPPTGSQAAATNAATGINTASVKQPFNSDDASKIVEPPQKKIKSEYTF